MKATNLAFTGIPVTDMKRARAFYEGTLAIGSVGDQWKPSPDGTSVAIEVDDFDAAIKDLKAANVTFAAEGIESPVCRMAVVQDPDGNKIIIHKLK
jgi:predicted enzyme related to lactoylglutathione lyase